MASQLHLQDKEIVNALTIIRDLGIKLGVKESELLKLGALCNDNNAKIEELTRENDELRFQVEDLLRTCQKESEKDSVIKKLCKEVYTLRTAYENLSEKSTVSITNLTKKHEVLQIDHNTLATKHEALQNDNDTLTKQIGALQIVNTSLSKKNETLQSQIDRMLNSYQERADVYSANIDSYEEDIERLQDEIHELRTEKQDMITALQKIVDELPQKIPSSSQNAVIRAQTSDVRINFEMFGLTEDVLKKIFSLGRTVITGGTVTDALFNRYNL